MESLFLSSHWDPGSVSVRISSWTQTILCLKITVAVAVACAETLSIHIRWKWLTFHSMPLCQYFYLALDPDPGVSSWAHGHNNNRHHSIAIASRRYVSWKYSLLWSCLHLTMPWCHYSYSYPQALDLTQTKAVGECVGSLGWRPYNPRS